MNIATALPTTNPPETDDETAAESPLAPLVAALAEKEIAEREARAEVKRRQDMVTLATQAATGYRDALAVATQALNSARVADAITFEHARRDAQVVSEAADRELAEATSNLDKAHEALHAANTEVAAAKRAIAIEQVRTEYYDMLADVGQAQAKFLKVLGAYAVLRDALTPSEWIELDYVWTAPADMQVVLPGEDLPLNLGPKSHEIPAKDVRDGMARDRFDLASAWWRRKLATMKASDFREGDAL